MALENGYYWSANLNAPSALYLTNRSNSSNLVAGNWDVCTVPWGDNWTYAPPASFTSVKLERKATITIKPRFKVDDPSSGFLILSRGPYADGTPENLRGNWTLSHQGQGMVFGRHAVPVLGHTGHRWSRYAWNGTTVYNEAIYWPSLDSTWWGNKLPVGPIPFNSTNRLTIAPNLTPPDATICNNIKDEDVYVAICWIDMLGRESALSPVLKINKINQESSHIVFRREYPSLVGASAVRVYAGYSESDLHRQPVLNHVGAEAEYDWPIYLQSYVLQNLFETGLRHSPSAECRSILCQPQQDIVDGKTEIFYTSTDYKLYCPFFSTYDYLRFGRIIGADKRKARFIQQETWEGQPLVKKIPLCYVNNQRDEINNASFQGNSAIAGLAFSDWSGGQCFSNRFNECEFRTEAMESDGVIISEQSSLWFGYHTASEAMFKSCRFWATIPINMEGNQTAKIRFEDRCGFGSSGRTRYEADTATFYIGSPNTFIFDKVEGVSTRSDKFTVRGLVSNHARTGSSTTIIKDIFIDTGIPVLFIFFWYAGSKVSLVDGERINSHSQNWFRIVEAPSTLYPTIEIKDVIMYPGSSVCHNLNQLRIMSNVPIGEIVTPTEEEWAAKGIGFQYAGPGNAAYYDYRWKPKMIYNSGFSDRADTTKTIGITELIPATTAGTKKAGT